MNTTATFPFGSLSESLAALTRSADAPALRAHLLGRRLPALGGDTEPAEIILRALGSGPNPQQLAAGLAPVLAQVIEESRAELQSGLTPTLRLLVDQTLQLAADLPANAELAASLEHLTFDLERVLPDLWLQDPLAPPLARALVHQQTDARAERLWYRLLETSSQSSSWTPQQRTVLLSAWRGLLYIPPNPEAARAGRVVNIDRIERGLLALEAGIRSREGGSRLIRQALAILDQTFPRSPQFWVEKLGPLLDNWPSALREAAVQQWPVLARVEIQTVRGIVGKVGRDRSALRGRFTPARSRFNQNDSNNSSVAVGRGRGRPVEPLPRDIRP